jgi:AcrR family transcriptional regulator
MESQSELHKPSLRPRRKQQDRREEATRRILESAIALVCEKGMVGVTMREIGVRAGCSRALATHHYGHKEGLLVALVEKVGADIRAARQASGRRKPGLESVLGIVGFYLGQNPDCFQVKCHRLGIGIGQHEANCRIALRAHGAKDIRRLRLLLPHDAGPGSLAGPKASLSATLPNAHFILKPDI